MITVPKQLYTKDIVSHLKYLISDKNAFYFDDLDNIHKDKLTGLAINAIGCDIDIVLDSYTTKLLAKHLLSKDRDDEIELVNAMHVAAHECLSSYFDVMISEMREEIDINRNLEAGLRPFRNRQTGEIAWSRIAWKMHWKVRNV